MHVALGWIAERVGILGISAALKLLEKGAGLTDGAVRTGIVGDSLDHLIGRWSAAEADELDAAWRELGAFDRLSHSD